jgi:hypothetical protein
VLELPFTASISKVITDAVSVPTGTASDFHLIVWWLDAANGGIFRPLINPQNP